MPDAIKRHFLVEDTFYDAGVRVDTFGQRYTVSCATLDDLLRTFMWDYDHSDAVKGWTPSIIRQFAKRVWRDGQHRAEFGRGRCIVLEVGEIQECELV